MKNEDTKDEQGCLKPIIYITIFFVVVSVLFSTLDSVSDFLKSLPWYLYVPVNIGIVYLVFKAFNPSDD
jgi:hypothetical protein